MICDSYNQNFMTAIRSYAFVFIAIMLAANCTVADEKNTSPVRPLLISDRSGIVPGDSVAVGIHFLIDAGWHIYWIISGDAGFPTDVEWNAQSGVDFSPLQWPLPKKFQEQKSLIVYGYDTDVLLTSHLRTDSSWVYGDTLTLSATASWLACREVCVPGTESLTIKLPSSLV